MKIPVGLFLFLLLTVGRTQSYFGRRTVFARYLAGASAWLSVALGRVSGAGCGTQQARIAFWFLLFGGRHRTSCSKVQCSVCWRGVCTVLGRHGEVRGILISVLGHSGPCLYGSGAGRVSISHLGRISCSRAPWRSARTPRAALRLNRGRGGNARSSPTQKACGGQPRSRRPPGGRVAA